MGLHCSAKSLIQLHDQLACIPRLPLAVVFAGPRVGQGQFYDCLASAPCVLNQVDSHLWLQLTMKLVA